MTEEWGDFSHYRVVGLADPRRRQENPAALAFDHRLRAVDDVHDLVGYAITADAPSSVLATAAVRTAESYFDMGYPGLAWKVTEGTDYEDPTWRAAYAACVSRGKWFMGYHFARNAVSGSAQADWFVSRLLAGINTGRMRDGGLDRFCLDQEDARTPDRAVTCTRAFTTRMVQRGVPAGLIYSGRWYADPNVVRLDDGGIPPGWRYGWLSDYGTLPDASIVLPRGWPRDRVVARQYTSTRPGLPGLPMGCDFNRTLAAGWPDEITGGNVALTSDDIPIIITAMKQFATDRLDAGGVTFRELLMQWGTVRAGVVQLTDDETKILAAVRVGVADIEAAIAAVSRTPSPPVDPPAFARAVVTELRDALVRGETDVPPTSS